MTDAAELKSLADARVMNTYRRYQATFVEGKGMYLYDTDSQRVVLSQQMDQAQRIDIDTTKNQVTLSGYPPQTRSLSKEHSYRIYFDRVPGGR